MVLLNKTKRMRVYTLSHEEVCTSECYCTSGTHLQTAHNPSTGERGVREVSLQVPMSVHIPAGGESENLPDSVLNSRQIKADVAARLLIVKGN